MSEQTLRQTFANIVGEDLANIAISTIVTPLTNNRWYTFTNDNVHLDVKLRIGFNLDPKSEEIKLTQNQDDSTFVNAGEKVILVKPKTGNSSPMWARIHTLRGEINKLAQASIIQVSREIFRDGKLIVEKQFMRNVYYSHLLYSEEFQDKETGGRQFHFTFRQLKTGEEVKDPRGFPHTRPTKPKVKMVVAQATKTKHIPSVGQTGLRSAFEIALAKYPS